MYTKVHIFFSWANLNWILCGFVSEVNRFINIHRRTARLLGSFFPVLLSNTMLFCG